MSSCSQICLDQGGSQSIHLVGSICLVAAKVFRIQYLDFNIWPKPLTAVGYSPRASKFWFRPLLPPIESGTWPSDCSCNCMHAAFVGQQPPSIYPTRLATCMYPPYTGQVTALTFYTIRPPALWAIFIPNWSFAAKSSIWMHFPACCCLRKLVGFEQWICSLIIIRLAEQKVHHLPLTEPFYEAVSGWEEVKTEIKIFAAKSENRVGAGKAQDQR